MTDERYTFIQTVKERKALVPSATKKPRKNYCSLPSDYLTKKEKISMNGEVTTMKFNHRYTWGQLKMFNSDLQKEYFTHIFTLYKVTGEQVAQMLGVYPTYIYVLFKNLGITPRKLRMDPNYQGLPWEAFGDTKGISSEKDANALIETKTEINPEPETKFSAYISRISITVKATSWQELYDACKNLPFPINEINIKIEEVI